MRSTPLRFAVLSLALLVNRMATSAEPTARPAPVDPAADVVRLVFVGDCMLDELPGEAIAKGVDPFADFADVFQAADFSIANLECVISTRGDCLDKKYTFRAHPRCVAPLKRHFTAVSLANNHTGDFGHEAFLEQLDLLKAAGLSNFGGGKNLAEARRPLMIERHGIKIALLGYNEFKPRSFAAGADTPGVAWSIDEQVVADIKAARQQGADLVIPFMHWGSENEPLPNDRQKVLARMMIDAGADVIVGGHPHVTEGAEYYHGKLIVYSLGNFVFNGFKDPEELAGWVLRLKLNKAGLMEWDTIVGQIDAQGIPHRDRAALSPSGDAGSPEIRQSKAR